MILTKTESDSLYNNTLFYANRAAFPGTGAIDKVYVSKDNGFHWTWNGSTYIDSEGRTGVYKALMTQTGMTAPTVTVLINYIGNIVWSFTSSGIYTGTLAGKFLANKTSTIIGENPNINGPSNARFAAYRDTDDTIIVYSYDPISDIAADDNLSNTYILIETYP